MVESAKRKANLVETLESTIPLILVPQYLPLLFMHQKNGLITAVIFSIFKLTHPTHITTADVR